MVSRAPPALASAALTVLVAVAVLALVAPHGSAQTLIPEVKVELDTGQESQVASVTDLAGDPDITFTGTITVTRPFSPNAVTVTPNAYVEDADARWRVTPNPSKLTFNGSGSEPFSIVISAPANLSGGATFKVTFNATASGLLYYNTLSDAGYIEVLQYFKLGHFASSEVIHIKQGDSRTLNFTVQNRGNGDDTVNIALGNEAELGMRGITILYEQPKPLKPWQSAKVSFILTTDIDATPGDVKFNFTLKSAGSGERVTASIDFSVVVEKAIIKGLLIKYWWAFAVGIALLVVVGILVVRRRGRRRDDEEVIAQMELAVPARKAAPPREVAGRPRRPARPRESAGGAEEEADEGGHPGSDEGAPPADEGEPGGTDDDDGAVEVRVGIR